ncbi:GBF-interacting protein 1-like isoform X2 [Dendrobium catenatum]|uniref:GBF-interacting protein 1 N-terminal domain-containing protein n=1 Tax=Dendrobium catenatum TaxID=906689 RepID=A0A2I0X348_9ASPA|nr:GBF-interacting protein 1-like isoform X2 [Dendrobium catenatum]PKU82343.1 hypothetical protein MA16_Dca005348 [Dendrobium catenatum]
MSAVSRVSIPSSVRKTIQNIKEIAGNHSDEEIYSMLKECSMDPNETAQKLLFQDTFHEVRRKCDKRKESNKEVADTNGRPGQQGRVGRTVRGSYSSRYTFHDSGAGRNLNAVKGNGIAQFRDKDITSLHHPVNTNYKAVSPERRSTAYKSRSMVDLPNGLSKAERLSADDTSCSDGHSVERTAVESKTSRISFQKKISAPSTNQVLSSITITSSAGVNTSELEPVLAPSPDASIPASVGAVKQEANADSVISQNGGGSVLSFVNERGSLEKKHSFVNGRVSGNSLEVEGTQVLDAFQSAPSNATVGASSSRPSSNYGNRSQHASTSLKAGPMMEWKPKSTNVNPSPSSQVRSISGVDLSKGKESEEAVSCFLHAADSMPSDISKEVLNLEDLCLSDAQHVIIPDHLQVPESERTGLSFGSFGSNFGLDMGLKIEPEKIKCPEEPSELSGEVDENVEQLPSCSRDESPVAEGNTYSDDRQLERPENHESSAVDILSIISPVADFDQSKAEVPMVTEPSQRSIIHAAPVYSNFGSAPQKIGSPFSTFDAADIHARDTARLPGFVVPQPFDPSTNYYASIYRPTAASDGRFSPFLLAGAVPKYNGNIAILPSQTSQAPQESGNSMVLSSTGPTPIVAQTPGVLQTSVAAGQQPVPVFRQPAGVHISHYQPNYNLYNQYFSPFYAPPTTIHHFLGNAAIFPQQLPIGSQYPPPTATAGTAPVKYTVSQYKTATNSGSTGQGTYGMNPAGYSSVVSGGNSTTSEDLSSSQFKENYVFIAGQQTEGSTVWISPPGRDISTLQPGSFYNVPSHGQPVAFAPTQAGHAAAFTGLYHPSQSLAAGSVHPLLHQSQAINGASEIAGPPGVYHQPQRSSQINWVNNF